MPKKYHTSTQSSTKISQNNDLHHHEKGFSLLEITLALVVIGIMASLTLKNSHILDTAKFYSLHRHLNDTCMLITQSQDMEGTNGNPNSKDFWKALNQIGLLQEGTEEKPYPQTPFQGCIHPVLNDPDYPGIWIKINKQTDNPETDNHGFLRPTQARAFLERYDTAAPTKGRIRAADSTGGRCLDGENFANEDTSHCILYYQCF